MWSRSQIIPINRKFYVQGKIVSKKPKIDRCYKTVLKSIETQEKLIEELESNKLNSGF